MSTSRAELTASTQDYWFHFLRTDLAVCRIMAEVARIESQLAHYRGRALSIAEEGHQAISHLMLHLEDPARQNEIMAGLTQVHVALDLLLVR